MKSTLNISLLLRTFSCIIAFCLFTFNVSAQETTLTVIGNAKGVPSSLKMTELKSVMKGEKQRWPDGTKIVIALMKTGTPIGQNSAKKLYKMTGDELNKFWLALVFQGKVTAPTFFTSVAELENFISQTPGAIGIISKPSSAETKSVIVDGKKEF